MVPNAISPDCGPRIGGRLARLLLIANFCCVGISAAQQAADISDIVFQPVLLDLVRGAEIEMGGLSERDRQALLDAIDDYVAAITPLRDAGSSSPELIGRLAALGLTYQRLGRHEQAIDTLAEAIELTVVNGGRNNLEQIPLLEQQIPSFLALDDISSIDDTEDFIYELNSAAYGAGSPEMYEATIALADWNTAAYFIENYRSSLGGKFRRIRTGVPVRLERALRDTAGGTNPIFSGAIKGVDTQALVDVRMRRIDRLYKAYQDAMSESGNVRSDIVIDIAKRIARLAHLIKQEMDFERDNYSYDPNYEGSPEQALRTSAVRMDNSYDTGRSALEYLLDILNSAPDLPPAVIASAQLDLADWHLVYGKARAAERLYEESYELLLDAGIAGADIDRALAPDMPPMIPLFATHLYSKQSAGLQADARLAYNGYVDIAYKVDELGNGVDLEFLGSSGEDTDRIEALIESQFKSIKFRPVLRGGELRGSGLIEARYYYAF
ncbi:MAG: hypothetical protein PVF50_02520 [Gammaproteobacteria bacterium]|jgi:tetratricopeptide (TPR) repeat protein